MTKARKPKPDRNRKAPAEDSSEAPSERSLNKQRRDEPFTDQQTPKHGSQRIPYSANKSTTKPEQAAEITIGARVSRRAADRLRAGHVWVYASDVEALELGDFDVPALLPVADYRGMLLGTALYSPSSQIALRLVSREAIDETAWLDLLASRLTDAIDKRMPTPRSEEKIGRASCRERV